MGGAAPAPVALLLPPSIVKACRSWEASYGGRIPSVGQAYLWPYGKKILKPILIFIYRHTSFYCISLYCVLQILRFLQIEVFVATLH